MGQGVSAKTNNGIAGEWLTMLDLIQRGAEVYHSVGGTAADIVALIDSQPLRIQVKSSVALDKAAYAFRGGYGRSRFNRYLGRADVLAFVAIPHRMVLYAPVMAALPFIEQESLRIAPGRFGQGMSDLSWTATTEMIKSGVISDDLARPLMAWLNGTTARE